LHDLGLARREQRDDRGSPLRPPRAAFYALERLVNAIDEILVANGF
jgi:hypothetical protein